MSAARVLVIGRSGQVATALRQARWPRGVSIESRGRESLDLRAPDSLAAAVAGKPWAAVINAAAYTQVDRAESEPGEAFAINRDGPKGLAEACARAGIPLIHLSTDYVFDGSKSEPYREDDPIRPVSVYGRSKAEGEMAVRRTQAAHVILRTSWMFSHTGTNFVKEMLRLGAERDSLSVVHDRRGCPTGAADIADAVVRVVSCLLAGEDRYGTFHFANAGVTTWYCFAREIFRQAALRGFAPIPRLNGIAASEYAAAAKRPMNSALDTSRIAETYGVAPRPWEEALSDTMDILLRPQAAVHERAACR